jgi:ligand-binding SRPBCC domain-containing protein
MSITITPHATRPGVMTLRAEQWLPRPLAEVFPFFADAHRLEEITPPWLNFHVLTPSPVPMFAGSKIDYRLKLHGIPLRWQSEISVWEPPGQFVDRQLRGPYSLWHHLHEFEELDGQTLVKDTVEYSVPLGWLLERWFVRPDLMKIFTYRMERIDHFLGHPAPTNLPTSP